ncbi:MAG: squalene--hopene cyclase [Gammaproteobacteria bacterium]
MNSTLLLASENDLNKGLSRVIGRARTALLERQEQDGHWCFELEADCTIPSEYILMMHYLGNIDHDLQVKLSQYIRRHQSATHGGWPLFTDGHFDLSCSIKAYYALKLAGDDIQAKHMERARQAILAAGGAACANVFTRITLYLFRQIPLRAIPFIPVEIVLLPQWFPFHLSKVSYWSRTVMVPLFILCSLRAQARNPFQIAITELFTVPADEEKDYFKIRTPLGTFFLILDRIGRKLEPWVPTFIRKRALRRACEWICERLNDESGLGAIFPAMVNAYEALLLLGFDPAHPYCQNARLALKKLLVIREDEAYCQPCVSPIWDTAFAMLALESSGPAGALSLRKAADWLKQKQITTQRGDWALRRPSLPPGGWAFQYANAHYPDLDDTAVVAWVLERSHLRAEYLDAIEKAIIWTVGMQSKNGGFASFDVDNTHTYLNEIPFADHGALLDPPTSDVSGHVLGFLGRLVRPELQHVLDRCLAYLRSEQEPNGSWFGRWGTNYIYGTAHVLIALEEADIDIGEDWVQRAAQWLISVQREDGGWGESNDTYFHPERAGHGINSTAFQTAWALLGLMAAGHAQSPVVRRGVKYLLETQQSDGTWNDEYFTAPGFPRVFYLNYHGYSLYFPLWALGCYQSKLNKQVELT